MRLQLTGRWWWLELPLWSAQPWWLELPSRSAQQRQNKQPANPLTRSAASNENNVTAEVIAGWSGVNSANGRMPVAWLEYFSDKAY